MRMERLALWILPNWVALMEPEERQAQPQGPAGWRLRRARANLAAESSALAMPQEARAESLVR